MKKLILATFAVFMLGAVLAATASAETTLPAEWLVGAAKITAKLATETVGLILLEDTKTIAGAASVLCSGIAIGSVGPNGEDETTEILRLTTRLPVGTPLTGNALICENEKTCAASTTESPIEVWPVGLPWLTTLFLMENGEILDLVTSGAAAKLIGYELLCLVLGIDTVDECTSEDIEVPVINDANGNAEIPGEILATPNASCSQSKEKTGVNETDELASINLMSGELLAVSSE
jgi:hypothetical protein